MADINFISTYMPEYNELTQEELYDVRDRLEQFIQVKFNDVDLNPNTVVGDLIITPQAYTIAAVEKGISRFASDLDLENVANDIIFNCDFVRKWLNVFNVTPSDSLQPSGVLRLVFNREQDYVLDRGLQFQLSGHTFTMYMPNPGPFYIKAPGRASVAGTNVTRLHDTGSAAWYADIPVVGETGALAEGSVAAGTAGLVSAEIENLASVAALIDFIPGSEEWSLPQLARQAQTTIYSASLNTRNGAVKFITGQCPFVESISAVHNGDKDMLRDYHNVYGLSEGCLDVYVRSKGYVFTEQQVLRLYRNADSTAYEGVWDYTGQPYHVESVTHHDVNLEDIECTITSTNIEGLGALAAYTQYEHLSVSVPRTLDAAGDSIYTETIDATGRAYTDFTITYQTDPMLPAITALVENKDARAVNTSILVRGFIPVIIDRFEIRYVRKSGTLPDLEKAAEDIKSYIAMLAFPDVYSDAEIARIMKEAGVKYVKDVYVKARVQWSVANKIMNYSGVIEDIPAVPSIQSSAGLRLSYPADTKQQTADDMYACSVRNTKLYLMENALVFREVKDL